MATRCFQRVGESLIVWPREQLRKCTLKVESMIIDGSLNKKDYNSIKISHFFAGPFESGQGNLYSGIFQAGPEHYAENI